MASVVGRPCHEISLVEWRLQVGKVGCEWMLTGVVGNLKLWGRRHTQVISIFNTLCRHDVSVSASCSLKNYMTPFSFKEHIFTPSKILWKALKYNGDFLRLVGSHLIFFYFAKNNFYNNTTIKKDIKIGSVYLRRLTCRTNRWCSWRRDLKGTIGILEVGRSWKEFRTIAIKGPPKTLKEEEMSC